MAQSNLKLKREDKVEKDIKGATLAPFKQVVRKAIVATPRTFKDLVTSTFKTMGLEPRISFIDTPEDIRDTYQYFTEADLSKLRTVGYNEEFTSLEDGIEDYVSNYLLK